ncbi:hypothetical protein Hanom_Chr07g00586221 [Helianthus anomalus]
MWPLFMFVHLTKRTKFFVRVRSFIKRTNTNELPANHFTNCLLDVQFVCSPTYHHNTDINLNTAKGKAKTNLVYGAHLEYVLKLLIHDPHRKGSFRQLLKKFGLLVHWNDFMDFVHESRQVSHA